MLAVVGDLLAAGAGLELDPRIPPGTFPPRSPKPFGVALGLALLGMTMRLMIAYAIAIPLYLLELIPNIALVAQLVTPPSTTIA